MRKARSCFYVAGVNLLSLLMIAVGLAMDAFAVSVTSGFAVKRLHLRHAFRVATFFGLFQALMPCLGWTAGIGLRSRLAAVDHWVAFGLLAFIGGKMIYESRVLKKAEHEAGLSLGKLLVLSVATSIDALAVGFSLSCLGIAIMTPALIIGAVTFGLCLGGVLIGARFGHIFENRLEAIGGLILIGIGLKIVWEHVS